MVARLAVGDGDQPFAELHARYLTAAFSLALRICRDQALAEEAVEEAMLGVWKAAATFDPSKGTVATWLLTIVHHRAVDTLRRHTSRGERAPPTPHELLDETAPLPGADEAALDAEPVRAALLQLPPEKRYTLLLCYYGGYTQRDVAEMLGVPLGTVKSRCSESVERLRKQLAPLASS